MHGSVGIISRDRWKIIYAIKTDSIVYVILHLCPLGVAYEMQYEHSANRIL